MGRIVSLPEDVRRRIAAGEVVERPVSVVKELVENSLDAGATRLGIELSRGGLGRIKIVDDGRGIPFADLERAVEPFATSKLTRVEDLFSLKTLGFRGEALASIGAVARLDIRSREGGASHGGRIRVEGGRVHSSEPAGIPSGSSVQVSDLFFNVPARRKFLKSQGAELAAITEWLQRIAVVRPDLSMLVMHDGRELLSLQSQDATGRLEELFGGELADALCPIDYRAEGLHLAGHVARPSVNRGDRRWVLLSVNGRPIKDKQIYGAVTGAFRTFLPSGRHPGLFMDIAVDPEAVDVNVHPAKYEIRFQNGSAVSGAIVRAVRDALTGEGVTPVVHDAGPSPVAEAPGWDQLPAVMAQQELAAAPADVGRSLLESAVGRAVQLHDAFIVAEHPDGVEIIDQHALHERILYDRMREAARQGSVDAQSFAFPERLDFDRGDVERLRALGPLLSSVGFDTRIVGETSIEIVAAPAPLAISRFASFFENVLSTIGDDDTNVSTEDLRERVVRIVACQSAIRFGDRLNPEEILALLAERKPGTFTLSCQHGRPTSWVIGHDELNRKFQR